MIRNISIALVVAGVVFASAGVTQAEPHGGRGGRGGGHVGRPPAVQAHPGFQGHRGFQGHPGFVARGFADHRRFEGRHFHRGGRGGVFIGVAPFVVGGAIAYGAVPYYYDPGYTYAPPAYSAPAPSYWYYCQSAGGYYPDVPSCPEPWVTVPAQ